MSLQVLVPSRRHPARVNHQVLAVLNRRVQAPASRVHPVLNLLVVHLNPAHRVRRSLVQVRLSPRVLVVASHHPAVQASLVRRPDPQARQVQNRRLAVHRGLAHRVASPAVQAVPNLRVLRVL